MEIAGGVELIGAIDRKKFEARRKRETREGRGLGVELAGGQPAEGLMTVVRVEREPAGYAWKHRIFA